MCRCVDVKSYGFRHPTSSETTQPPLLSTMCRLSRYLGADMVSMLRTRAANEASRSLKFYKHGEGPYQHSVSVIVKLQTWRGFVCSSIESLMTHLTPGSSSSTAWNMTGSGCRP